MPLVVEIVKVQLVLLQFERPGRAALCPRAPLVVSRDRDASTCTSTVDRVKKKTGRIQAVNDELPNNVAVS
jgi:hypothetical protein